MRVSSSKQCRRNCKRRSTEDPQHGPPVGHSTEPCTEESTDLRSTADVTDTSDNPGEA